MNAERSGAGRDDAPARSLPKGEGWTLYRRLLAYAAPYWPYGVYCILGAALAAVGTVSMADVTQLLVDSIGAAEPRGGGLISAWLHGGEGRRWDDAATRWLVPCLILLSVFARGLGVLIGGSAISYASHCVTHDMRCALGEHMLRLPTAFYDRHPESASVSRMTYNVSQVGDAVTLAVQTVVREGLTAAGLLAYLLYLQWQLTLLFLALSPAVWAIMRVWSLRLRTLHWRVQREMASITRAASDIAHLQREIRIFDAADSESRRLRRVSLGVRRNLLKAAVSDLFGRQAIQLIVAGSLAAVVWFLLAPERVAGMSGGTVVGFVVASGMLARPIQQLLSVVGLMERGLAASRDIFACLDEPVEADRGSLRVDRVRGQIDVRGLSFRYANADTWALQDVELSAAPGDVVALVGRSGAGKSTLAALLTRSYEKWRGQILLDEAPIQDYALESLRAQFSVVSQTNRMLNDTVYNNIAYGALASKPRSAVAAAAEQADALEFIASLPQGWDTVIGDSGVLLSVGQCQRLLIARALLKDAPVLILDEATASLDNESERRIQAVLERSTRGRTTLVIAHRLSTVRRASRIVTLRQGRVVESGAHDELLARDGEYAKLYRSEFRDA